MVVGGSSVKAVIGCRRTFPSESPTYGPNIHTQQVEFFFKIGASRIEILIA